MVLGEGLQVLETEVQVSRVLDACCGSRMFWFEPENEQAVFVDRRSEQHILCDGRTLNVAPDIIADFTNLPFPDGRFSLVVFDPPHLVRAGNKSWMVKKYGKLSGAWKEDIRKGFSECFRVLKPDGTMIFKWNEHDVKVDEILALCDVKPLFGNRCGRLSKSHWIVFIK